MLKALQFLVLRWILHRKYLIAPSKLFGLRFKALTSDKHGRRMYKRGVHEEELTRFLIGYLRFEPGDVVLDIGANIGWYSLVLDRVAPAGVRIFSFEPDPVNYALLSENVRLNEAQHVTPVPLGLAESEGTRRLYLYKSSNRGRHSFLPQPGAETIDVRTTSLDSFWKVRRLGKAVPRFIKIDIEGYELFALRGAARTLGRCPTMLLEYSPQLMHRAGIDPRQLLSLLVDQGWSPRRLVEQRLVEVDLDRLASTDEQINLVWLRA